MSDNRTRPRAEANRKAPAPGASKPRRRPSGADRADRAEAKNASLDQLLDQICAFFNRYVAFPSWQQTVAVALWVVHTYAIEFAYSTPRLLITSVEKQSGKTRLVEVLDLLVRRPMRSTDPSAASIFRSLRKETRTLLIDEADLIFGANSVRDATDLRALLNSGHRQGQMITRCVGPNYEAEEFPTFAPAAIAGLGRYPDTLVDRSIVIGMKRRRRDQQVERLRYRSVEPEAAKIRSVIEQWVTIGGDVLAALEPDALDELDDRANDAWEPLLAIASEAGGRWPDLTRQAAVVLSAGDAKVQLASELTRLLLDLRTLFNLSGEPYLPSEDIVEWITESDDSQLGGEVHARRIARLLAPHGVRTKNRMTDRGKLKVYVQADLEDVFTRYLPPSVESRSAALAALPAPATNPRRKLPRHRAEQHRSSMKTRGASPHGDTHRQGHN